MIIKIIERGLEYLCKLMFSLSLSSYWLNSDIIIDTSVYVWQETTNCGAMQLKTKLTVQDLEHLQSQHPDYRMELVNGEVIVMSPSGYESDEIATEMAAQLRNLVKPRKLGRVTGSSAGFTLLSSDTRAPDVSFVRAERLRRSPRSFAELAPDLVVEVKSPTDSLIGLREK
jgi:Uma2 family endonuclease